MMRLRKRTVVLIILLCLLASIFFITFSHAQNRKEGAGIGVLMWEGDYPLFHYVENYASLLEPVLGEKIQIMYCNGSGYTDYERILQNFRRQGGEVVINVVTEDLYRIIRSCEENGLYLLQMWEMPDDTDYLDALYKSDYFLGSLVCDEKKACADVAGFIEDSGAEKAMVVTSMVSNANCAVHHLRNLSIREHLTGMKEIYSLESQNIASGIRFLADEGDEADVLFTSSGNDGLAAKELKNLLHNDRLRLAYFDENAMSKQQLEDGDLLVLCCGQQNVFELSAIYAAAFLKNKFLSERKLEVTCPYLEISTPEAFDIYLEKCVDTIPFSQNMAQDMMQALLKGDTSALEEYAQGYSIEWLSES